jgi:hypothetical protein
VEADRRISNLRFAIRNLIIAIAACVAGCASHRAETQSQPPTTAPVLYHRTGGVAGTDDRVVIWPDGFVQVHGRLMGDAEVQLPQERLVKLHELLPVIMRQHSGTFDMRLSAKSADPDAYRITLFFSGDVASFDDIAAGLRTSLTKFTEAYTEIEEIAAEAVNRAPTTPAPAAP